MSPAFVPVIDPCMAQDYSGHTRGTHNPCLGLIDGKPITSCAWCGRTLEVE